MHFERNGPLVLGERARIKGFITGLGVIDGEVFAWAMVSANSYESEYEIVPENVEVDAGHVVHMTLNEGEALHLVRFDNGGVRNRTRHKSSTKKDRRADESHPEGDQQEVLVEDGDPPVGPDPETVEMGESVSDQI